MKKWSENVLIAAMVGFLMVCALGIYTQYTGCKEARGHLVLGVFNFECLVLK